jgi:hypothetical protein
VKCYTSPHLTSPPPPLPCVNKYTVYTYIVCKGGGYGMLGLIQINTCREVPLQVKQFLDDDILHCLFDFYLSTFQVDLLLQELLKKCMKQYSISIITTNEKSLRKVG